MFVFPESVKEDEWLRVVNTSLHPGADYVLVKHVRLVGMMLIVYVKTAHLEHVSSVGRHRHHGQPRQQGRRQHPVHLPLNQLDMLENDFLPQVYETK